ncbi:MAG: septal ring lytic transglycosylase RlpA family protein [Rhizobiaceae bacterium]
MVAKKSSQSKEYFAEKEYGVKASPRVVNVAMASVPGMKMKRLPRGGGRDQLGKPYQIKGKWYYPKEDPTYRAAGIASWYGDAFHGRLTANGEIYDMNHLSAAHPTMPLPSYARVTNKSNGNSVIVRVNDRGPYAHGRVIDLSRRAAELLDYTSKGTATVVVEYVGRAPVNGADDEYLTASYQPGGSGNPGEGQPRVMVAMSGDSLPGVDGDGSLALDGPQVLTRRDSVAPGSAEPFDPFAGDDGEVLPVAAPAPAARPSACDDLLRCQTSDQDLLLSGYADRRVASGHAATAAFDVMRLDANTMRAWREQAVTERILVGAFTKSEAAMVSGKLAGIAAVKLERDMNGAISVYAKPKKGKAVDTLLRTLWKSGFEDAFVVR